MHVFLFCSQTQSLDTGLELKSAYMEAHLAEQPVARERMKAKPNESTHSQILPANICPRLQASADSILSRQSEAHSSRFSHLSCRSIGSFMCCMGSMARGAWKHIKNVVCNSKTKRISVSKCGFIFNCCFADVTQTTEIRALLMHAVFIRQR